LFDGDTVFTDSTGALNVMDSNNLAPNGFMRNRINSPFGASSLSGVGANMYGGVDSDFAYKADEGRLFVTEQSTLAEVNDPASNLITTIGSYGTSSSGTPFRMLGIAAKPVPEPASLSVIGLGVAALLRRRLKR